MKLRLVRKRGGRSYVYREGSKVTPGWAIQDEDGKQYKSWEEYQEANKPKPKPKVTKKVVKKDDKDED